MLQVELNSKNRINLIIKSIIVLSSLFAFILPTHAASPTPKPITNTAKKISITQIVEHPALDAVRAGVMEELQRQGFKSNDNIIVQYENAQGSIVTAAQIATKLISNSPDLIVTISTPSAQAVYFAALKQSKKIPIVFTAVTDPTSAKLEPGKEAYPITGVTDKPNLEGLTEVIKVMLPRIKKLGVMYNPSEVNSVSTVHALKKLLEQHSIEAVEVTVSKIGDVPGATRSLIGKVDALYFPQDNTVVAAIDAVVNIAGQGDPALPVILPIFSSDPILIERGVLAAVGYDYRDLGRETGDLVAQILKGKSVKELPIQDPKSLKTVINLQMAEKLQLPVPQKLRFSEVTLFKGKDK